MTQPSLFLGSYSWNRPLCPAVACLSNCMEADTREKIHYSSSSYRPEKRRIGYKQRGGKTQRTESLCPGDFTLLELWWQRFTSIDRGQTSLRWITLAKMIRVTIQYEDKRSKNKKWYSLANQSRLPWSAFPVSRGTIFVRYTVSEAEGLWMTPSRNPPTSNADTQ